MTTKKEQAAALLAIANDPTQAREARVEALAQAEAIRKSLKISRDKLGGVWPTLDEAISPIEAEPVSAQETTTTDETQTIADEATAELEQESVEHLSRVIKEATVNEAHEVPTVDRGAIGVLVRDLLVDPTMDYEAIVGKVRAQYPSAKTTARSIASVAADMRRDGIQVPSRRKRAKAQAPAA